MERIVCVWQLWTLYTQYTCLFGTSFATYIYTDIYNIMYIYIWSVSSVFDNFEPCIHNIHTICIYICIYIYIMCTYIRSVPCVCDNFEPNIHVCLWQLSLNIHINRYISCIYIYEAYRLCLTTLNPVYTIYILYIYRYIYFMYIYFMYIYV